MSEQELYAQCLKLIPDKRPAFIRLHTPSGLTAEGFWRYTRNPKRRTSVSKAKTKQHNRATILATQGYRCALCKQLAEGRVVYLDKTGQVVCGQCNQLLAAWRPAQTRGVTEAGLVAFEEAGANTETDTE